MNDKMIQAYKRICFHGRGIVARLTDRAFFSLLGGVCFFLLFGDRLLSVSFMAALLVTFLLWGHRRWMKYKHSIWQKTVKTLKQEDWLRQEAERIRQEGGKVLYPVPDAEALLDHCLRSGEGTTFHCFGEEKGELIALVESCGCTLSFHPWQEGSEPSREQVIERLRRDAPKRDRRIWHALLHLPGNRYLLTGCVLLLLSMALRHALYWRLLGSLCLCMGAIRRALHVTPE